MRYLNFVSICCRNFAVGNQHFGEWLISMDYPGEYLYSRDGNNWQRITLPNFSDTYTIICPTAQGWFLGTPNENTYKLVVGDITDNPQIRDLTSSAFTNGNGVSAKNNAIFLPEDNIIAVGTVGTQIAYSVNNGLTFSKVSAPVTDPPSGIENFLFVALYNRTAHKLCAITRFPHSSNSSMLVLGVIDPYYITQQTSAIGYSWSLSMPYDYNDPTFNTWSCACTGEGILYVGMNQQENKVAFDLYNKTWSYVTSHRSPKGYWIVPHIGSQTVAEIDGETLGLRYPNAREYSAIQQLDKITYFPYGIIDSLGTVGGKPDYNIQFGGENRTYAYSILTGETLVLSRTNVIYHLY